MAGVTIKLTSGVTNRVVLTPKTQAQLKLTRVGMPGPMGPLGPTGPTGPQGTSGPGFAALGTTGQILKKASNTSYDTLWGDESVLSVAGRTGVISLTKTDVGLTNVPNTDATVRANHTGTQLATTISDFNSAADARITTQKGNPNGLASLDGTGKVPSVQLPALVTNNTYVVASQAAMLALSAAVGDIAVRTDTSTNFILQSLPASTLGNWIELAGTGAAVSSVNTQTGAVVLGKADVGLANVDNTSDANKPVSTATQTALDAKQALDSDLTIFAGLTPSNDDVLQRKSGAWINRTPTQLKVDLLLNKVRNVTSTVTLIVDAAGSGDYTTIQAALDAVPSGGCKVLVRAGYYVLGTGLLIKQSGTILEGEGLNTQIEVNGASIPIALGPNTIGLHDVQIRNMYLIQSNATRQGVAIDTSDSPDWVVESMRASDFGTGLQINDTSNLSFYCTYHNLILFTCVNGVVMKGNPVNDNTFINIRTLCVASGIGLDLQTGNGNTFTNFTAEPNSATGTVGVKLGATAYSNTFNVTYCENNASGILVTASAVDNIFNGGIVSGNTADITDNGTNTKFFGVALTSGGKNSVGELSTALTLTSGGTGATSASAARISLGLGNVDNTSDLGKPISTATQTALNLKANDVSVVHLTGNETISGTKGFSTSPQVPSPTGASDATPKNYVDGAITTATPDATTSVKGKVQLTNDLGGTATSPIVKSRAVTLTVGLANVDRVMSNASDYATINTAINDVSTAGGGQVVLRFGAYTPTDHIRLKSNVHLVVEKGATVTLAQGKSIVFGNGLTNVVVDGLQTDATAHVANDKAYQIDANTDVTIKNCRLLNCAGFGIFVSTSGTDVAGRLTIRHNRITGLGNNDLIGGGPLNSTGAIVMDIIAEGNFVSQNASLGNNYKFAFDIVGAYRLKFVNNNVEGGMIFGSEQSPHHHSMIQNNTIKNPNGVACAEVGFLVGSGLTNPGDGIIISNNTIENGFIIGSNSNASPLFTNVAINGNVINATGANQSNGEGGIRTNNLDGVTIIGNIIHDSGSHGIWLVSTQKALVIGNVVRDSALGGIKEDTGSNNNVISLNYLSGNTSGNISSIAANTTAFNNGNVNPMINYAPGNISGSVTFRRTNGHITVATITGNLTATLANGDVKGDMMTLLFKQDATGGWTVSWSGSNYKFGPAGNPQLASAAAAITAVTFEWDGSTWNELSRTLPQALDTGSSPTFASLTLSSPLSVANGGTGATASTGSGSVVLASSPTIVTPTIASFTNATHNHTNAAGGGQLTDAALSAAVGIAKGGTGQTTATTGFNALAPSQSSNSGKYLTTDGTNTSWATVTGFSNPMTTQGDIIYGGSSGAATRLAAGSSTQVLLGGTSPSWGAVILTSMVSGTLPVANGGIGQTSLTSLPLTTPLVTTSILDSAGNTMIGFTPAGSAVNYVNVTNATGTPIISTAGSSSNISLLLQTKGTGSILLRPGSNGTTAIQLQNAAGSTTVLDVDTSNTRVGIGKTPTVTFDVSGLIGLLAGTSTTVAKAGGSIFNHFADAGNTSTTETDLYSDSTPANALGTNGDRIVGSYGGIFVSSATATRQIKVYFGGTAIFDSGALSVSISASWTMDVIIIRVSSTVVRYSIDLQTEGAALSAYTAVGELTGLTLSSANILKVTGTAAGVGAATNDIVAKMGAVSWQSA